MDDGHEIGRRVREIRAWRGMTQTSVAQLAGFANNSYLSKVERGLTTVTKRSTLEALAHALRVAPTELTGQPYTLGDPATAEAHAVVAAVEEALTECELGELPEAVQPRPWPALVAELRRLNRELRPRADYAGQGEILPALLYELHATYVTDPDRRRDVLVALLHVYHCAAVLTKNLGVRGLPVLAAHHARQVAEELEDPTWLGMVAWLRGHAAGSAGRARQYTLSVRAADELSGRLDDADAAQVYGMLHLNAALAAAAQSRPDETEEHLAEAARIAGRLDAEVGSFGNLYFGRTNVGIWRVTLATELGKAGRVAELARDVHPEVIPSAARQGMYWADLGRALAAERGTRDRGIQALVRAERIAPQRIRNNVFVREAVADLVSKARRDAGGRELRGLAWRMGVAPTG